jgi:hypothetical protein
MAWPFQRRWLGDEIPRGEHDFRRRFGLPSFHALNEFHNLLHSFDAGNE